MDQQSKMAQDKLELELLEAMEELQGVECPMFLVVDKDGKSKNCPIAPDRCFCNGQRGPVFEIIPKELRDRLS